MLGSVFTVNDTRARNQSAQSRVVLFHIPRESMSCLRAGSLNFYHSFLYPRKTIPYTEHLAGARHELEARGTEIKRALYSDRDRQVDGGHGAARPVLEARKGAEGPEEGAASLPRRWL